MFTEKLQSIYRRWKIRFNNHHPYVYLIKKTIVPKIIKAPPIPLVNETDEELELHALVSKKDFLMLMWSLYSFYTHCRRKPSLIVHDDGTLSMKEGELLTQIFPGAKLISRQESDAALDEFLASYPNCKTFRYKHPLNLKLFDFFYFAQKEKIIFFDSDIIFYDDPEAIFQGEKNTFIEDVWTSYILPLKEVNQHFHANLPPCVNIGFGQVLKSAYNIPYLESILSDSLLKNAPYLFCQTTTALMISQQNIQTIGGDFKMTLKQGVGTYKLKHYTRVMRGLFYTEGVYFFYQNYLK